MKKRHKHSKYIDECAIVESTILKIDYKNKLVGSRYKTVFYCPSQLCPEGRMCVVWGNTSIETGDSITMKGRYLDGVFLVWSILVQKRAAETAKNGSI